MARVATLPLGIIRGTRYSKVLNYPAPDDSGFSERLNELASIGVTAIRFVGPSLLDGIQILGKGCVGIVVQAVLEGRLVALKIRRLDADRASMFEEARLLRLANSVEVGPRLIAATKNFLVMELFDGIPLFRWANRLPQRHRFVKLVLPALLDDCFRLDSIGLDHGELSHAHKNVLIARGGRACIVDFESASMIRRAANVTSLLQYFLFGNISKTLQTSTLFPLRRKVLRALADYKHEGSVESYRSLREILGFTGD